MFLTGEPMSADFDRALEQARQSIERIWQSIDEAERVREGRPSEPRLRLVAPLADDDS
jgi:hypothetical protein